MPRKEFIDLDPVSFYDEMEARKYNRSGGIRRAQYEMTYRALELLDLPVHSLVLDVGCGTGFSMEILTKEDYITKGIDIAGYMLEKAKEKGFDVVQGDMRNIPFTGKSFDGIISISTLQWGMEPPELSDMVSKYRIIGSEFYRVLTDKGRGVVQFYPRKMDDELEITEKAFQNSGLLTKIVVDRGTGKKADKKYILIEKQVCL